MMYLRVFLKVCEGCGSLWYRTQGCSGVYCAQCTRRLKDFPKPTAVRRGRRPRHPQPMVLNGGVQ
jgi:hypothetical protein